MNIRVPALFLLPWLSLALPLSACAASPGPATLAYQNEINGIVIQLVVPALGGRLDELAAAGGAKINFRVTATGKATMYE